MSHRLAHQLEGTLLGLVARRKEMLNGLLARRMLLARNDATTVLHQILLLQAAGRVLGRAVVDLRLAARRHLGRLRRLASVLATEHFLIRSLKFIGERGLRDLSEK